MLTEVSFRTLKYVIFNGQMNKRMDDLIYSVEFRLLPYFLARHNAMKTATPRFNISLQSREGGLLLYRYEEVLLILGTNLFHNIYYVINSYVLLQVWPCHGYSDNTFRELIPHSNFIRWNKIV
tara:strand:- start:165 stop:533 length:369 start_codon:yes stop_codon:yes gene_type:complete